MRYAVARAADFLKLDKRRDVFSTKRSNGRVMVFGGSSRYHGAVALASLAALKAGAGYVVSMVPKKILVEERAVSPNIIVMPSGMSHLSFGKAAMGEIEKSDSVIIGPGAGRDPPTLRAYASAITYACLAGKNLVIDADGLLAINGSINSGRKENVVLTPNDKEAKALAGTAVDAEGPSSMPKRIKIAIHIARTYNASVILKGHKSIVTDGARVKVIVPKTATLATMGTGDVLSGILSFYLLQSSNAFDAAVGAAYLHAMVGDYIAANFGEHAIASDIIDNIPATISWISRGNKDIRK